MATAAVGSIVLVAATSARDVDHGSGRDVVDGIDSGALLEGRLSNYVIAET